MAKSTFSGPIRSKAGIFNAGSDSVVSLTADTTLTVDAHAGRILACNDADGKFTLPTILSSPLRLTLNNLGATYTFFIETAATDLDILTDGTDKFVGGLYTGKDDATGKTFIAGATNDVITLNGSTTGGLAGTIITCKAIGANRWGVQVNTGGTGDLATPFSAAVS